MNLKQAEVLVQSLLDEEELIDPAWIAEKGYIGVVSPYHIAPELIGKIALYCKSKGVQRLFYIPTNIQYKNFKLIIPKTIPAKYESIFLAEHESNTLAARIIFAENLEFLINTDGREWHIVVGNEEFIRHIFGEDGGIQNVQNFLKHLDFLKPYKPADFMYTLAKRYPGRKLIT